MKIKHSLLALAVCSLAAVAQQKVTVNGTVSGYDNINKVFIYCGLEEGYHVYDAPVEVPVINGKFSYTHSLNVIVPAWVKPDTLSYSPTHSIYLIPGETLNVDINAGESTPRLDGTGIYRSIAAAYDIVNPSVKAIEDFRAKAEEVIRAIPQDQAETPAADSIMNVLNTEYFSLMEANHKVIEDFLDNNLSNQGAILYLSDLVDATMLYEALPDEVKATPVGRTLSNRVEVEMKMRKAFEQQEEVDRNQLLGQPAPAVELTDINGNPFSLTSLRGKYVILDFWGSWCGWCIKGFPDMKAYYEKYKGKFEIVGIDCNDSDAAWRRAVADNDLPWIHVYNHGESTLTSEYKIKGYPTKILVDPDGNVAHITIGEDPAFYPYLDEVFGN